jgi:hypothetical protein
VTHDPLYAELSFYTLSHAGGDFIHQHVVDAYFAQTADSDTKPITLFFALVGLYLYIEKGQSGRVVQQAHMQIANKTKQFPAIVLPQHRGKITVQHVMQAAAGPERDAMIHAWCRSVWEAYGESHGLIGEWIAGFAPAGNDVR